MHPFSAQIRPLINRNKTANTHIVADVLIGSANDPGVYGIFVSSPLRLGKFK